MAPETSFVSISPPFFDPFKPTNCVQSNHKYVQILGKFAHRSPSNFWLLLKQFVDLNGSKNSREIDTNMVLESFIFGYIIRPGPTGICKVQ